MVDPRGLFPGPGDDDPEFVKKSKAGIQAGIESGAIKDPLVQQNVWAATLDYSPAKNLHQDRIDGYVQSIQDMVKNKRDPSLILAKLEKLRLVLAGEIQEHDRKLYEESLSSAIMYMRSITDIGLNMAGNDSLNKLAPHLERLIVALRGLGKPGTVAPAPAPQEKFVPNPGGRPGNPATKAKIAEVIADCKSRGLVDIQTEVHFPTPGGLKARRFADVVAKNPQSGEIEIIQVGKALENGQPIIREREAWDDIIMSPAMKQYQGATLRFVDVESPGVIQPPK